jgi:pimeloyl-ACP methyl ester carboxylesterase
MLLASLAPNTLPGQGIPVPGQPYERFTTTDSLGRSITFYLSEATGERPLPLMVYVQGSGASSHFVADEGRYQGATGHSSLRDAVAGRMRLLLVEKSGALFGDDGKIPSRAFREEHTLPRWSAAIAAAIAAAKRLPGVDGDAVTVVGHSEGGIAAARVAGTVVGVTSVVLIAGEGPSQLYSLIRLVRSGDLLPSSGADPESRERSLLASWDSVLAHPTDAGRTFFGHAYPRWATFMGSSPAEELAGFDGRVLIVQGTADRAVDPTAAEVLLATLRSRGQVATLWRVEGADHSFRRSSGEDLWPEMLRRVVEWSADSTAP